MLNLYSSLFLLEIYYVAVSQSFLYEMSQLLFLAFFINENRRKNKLRFKKAASFLT